MIKQRVFQNLLLQPGKPLQALVHLQAEEPKGQSASLAVGIVIDRSSSMLLNLKAAKEAAVRLLEVAHEEVTLMVVAFSDQAQVIVPPIRCDAARKKAAARAIRSLEVQGGTCMSAGLQAVVRGLFRYPAQARKILFLTDGRSEESRQMLEQAVAACRAQGFEVTAWGLGSDWDEEELRYIASETMGEAQFIAEPHQMKAAFARWLTSMEQMALTHVRLDLNMRGGVSARSIKQIHPQVIPLVTRRHPQKVDTVFVSLGSLAHDERRVCLVELDVPPGLPGERIVVARPTVSFINPAGETVEEAAGADGWVYAEFTQDPASLSVEPHVQHYLNQHEIATLAWDGQAALAVGDNTRATLLLTRALTLSQQVGNEHMTKILSDILVRDNAGTLILNLAADPVKRKSLALDSLVTKPHDPVLDWL